jgi:non-ribosomal peptide synthetase component F/acyl carrier protein
MSLTEIQLTLAACPGVESAVVNVADGQLAAYVVPAEADIQATEVRRFLAQRLPRGMVPTRIQVVPSQPVTGSGKADVAALTGVAEPQPADLRRIWSAVLAIDDVQDEDDFFELGGDSLGAALLTARVRAELGVDLPAGVLFEHPTLMEVAALVGRASAVVPSLPAAADRRTGPLSPLQRRLWLLHQLDGGLAGYNIPIVLDLTGELDVPALTGALNDLVTRHDALRTEIASGPDPVQRVHQHVDLELARVAFRDHESARRWLAAEVRRPFDLARPPLLRAALLTLPGGGHRFVLTMHHLVSDGWTVRILLTELGHAYQARHAGRAPHFEPLPLSYLDYSTWQADQLDSGRYTRQLASWCDRLDGCPPPLRLPHPCAPETQPGHHRRLIGAALTDDLRELARESRTTLFVTLLAGFVAVLGTWTGRDDVVVGVPFGSRTTPGTEDLVGFFVNTVALRVTSAAGASFTDLVRTARASVAHAASNPDVPFDVVHHHLRRAGTELTLSTWFNYLGDPDPVPDLPGVLVAPADPPPAGALFDLNVYITDHGHRLAIDVVYDATRVDGGAAVALADQYERLLNLVAAAPEAPVAHHGLGPVAGDGPGRVAGDGPGRVAGDGPGPVRTAPEHGASDHAPVLTTVSRQRPEAVAIRSMSGAMTYAALSAWAGALGKELRDAGIGRDDLVAVYAAREPALVAAMLAIWSTGASCCVLDPAYPPQRLVEQLAAAGPVAALLTGVDAPAPLRGRVPRSIAIGAPRRGPALPEVAWHGGHVGFTSGTTGVPKVVSASGLPLARFLDWYATAFQLRPTDRFAMLSGLAHDPLLRDAFAPLRVGATLCIPPADLIRAPRELRQWLVDEQVTVLHVTPQLLRLLGGANGPRMGHGGANGPRMGHGGANGPRMDHVRLIVCGGDQLFAGDVRAIRLIAPAATVVNAYGTTETPQVMACHVIPPGVPIGPDERRIPIGTGINGVSVVVLGPHSGPAAIGAVGRIVVRTPFLADGYGPEFDTGDLGRYLPDGQIELLGRADDQVKVAGYRLESQEIDAVVRRLPYVVDCRTVADGQQLITYAVCATAVSTAQLRSDLRPLLPGHMIPTGLVRLPSLPLTANNKLDRRALPAWHPPEPEPPARPHTALEQRIADVWCTVLDRSAVSTEANFFDLGGTSLLMAQVQGGLEQTLRRQIPMLMLFEHSTVRSLAAHLANGAGASTLVARRRSRSFADAPHRLLVRREIRRDMS